MDSSKLMLDVTLGRTSIPSRGVRHTPSHFMLQKPEISNCCIGGPLTQHLNADTFYMCIPSSWNTITSIYFIRLNKSLHLFEKHCTFLPLFNPNLDFLQAVKVTKSGHHLLHDWGSKGYGSIPGWPSQTCLHACLQRLTTLQTRNRSMPLSSSAVQQVLARFHNFYSFQQCQDWFKKAQCISNRYKGLFKQKNILGLGAL